MTAQQALEISHNNAQSFRQVRPEEVISCIKDVAEMGRKEFLFPIKEGELYSEVLTWLNENGYKVEYRAHYLNLLISW